MARPIEKRLMVQGQLRAVTPLHVGGFGQSVETDLPLARDGQSAYYIPGTSLAGPIREWCRASFLDETLVQKLWGFQELDQGHASFVLIEDAPVKLPGGATIEIRDGVGIDRIHGSAAEHIKYDRAILPSGTTFNLTMSVEIPPGDGNQSMAMIGHLLEALEAEQIRFGASRTRGLGRVKLEGTSIRIEDYTSKKGIIAVLRARSGPPESAPRGDPTLSAKSLRESYELKVCSRPRLDIDIEWEPDDVLMVKAGYEAVAVDALPLMSGVDQDLAPVLPGSSIKGVFRSQAERIIRTVLGLSADDSKSGLTRFLAQVRVPLVECLFGSAGEKASTGLGLGALTIDDCFAEIHVTRDDWRTIESAEDDLHLLRALKDAKLLAKSREDLNNPEFSNWSHAYHVAIDRWTGGAADQLLFTAMEPRNLPWKPMRLSLDFDRFTEDDIHPALVLLLMVLRDLCEDRMPLGFATNRGMGSIRVTKIDLKGSDLDRIGLEGLANGFLDGANPLEGLDAKFRKELTEAWTDWIAKNREGLAKGTTQ